MDVRAQLTRWLSHITQPTVSAVEREMRKWYITYEQITPFITSPVPPKHYGRNVIATFQPFEAIVLNIPPHIETPVHDHGESFCCVKVMAGVLYNRIYELDKTTDELKLTREEKYVQGDYFTVTKDQIHSMYNPTDRHLITFHVYSPPIQNNHIYKETSITNPISP
jgi:cysteine dioxygenase